MLDRLEETEGIRIRFVLGHWPEDPELEQAVDAEEAEAGDILRLPINETYQNLPMKVRRAPAAAPHHPVLFELWWDPRANDGKMGVLALCSVLMRALG